MKINLKRLNDAVHFEATNETGQSIHMDGGPSIGGVGKGVSPMETLLMAAAGCSSIDIVIILRKMRQQLDDLEVEVTGDKVKLKEYSYFKTIHLHFKLYGDLDEKKCAKAVDMSIQTYCSVSKILEKSAEITTSFEIIK